MLSSAQKSSAFFKELVRKPADSHPLTLKHEDSGSLDLFQELQANLGHQSEQISATILEEAEKAMAENLQATFEPLELQLPDYNAQFVEVTAIQIEQIKAEVAERNRALNIALERDALENAQKMNQRIQGHDQNLLYESISEQQGIGRVVDYIFPSLRFVFHATPDPAIQRILSEMRRWWDDPETQRRYQQQLQAGELAIREADLNNYKLKEHANQNILEAFFSSSCSLCSYGLRE